MSEGRALGFIGCYLLQSLHEKAKGKSYIGFTINPRRRIRQHNGEISNGAARTKKWRPWEMVLVVHGFATQTAALQFEWAWQHPERSLDMREAAAKVGRKARYGVKGKVLVLMEMLNTSPWKYYPLKVQFLSGEGARLRAGAPPLPAHMNFRVGPLEDLPEEYSNASAGPCSDGDDISFAGTAESPMLVGGGLENAAEVSLSQRPKSGRTTSCIVCGSSATRTWAVCAQCSVRSHLGCLAERFLEDLGESGGSSSSSIPTAGRCPCCGEATTWGKVLETSQHAGWAKHKKTAGTKAQPQQQAMEEDVSKKAKGAGAAGVRRRAAAAAVAPAVSASQTGLSEAEGSAKEEGGEDCTFSPPAWLDERPPSMSDASEPFEALPWEDYCSTSPSGSECGSRQRKQVQKRNTTSGGDASSSSIEVVDLVSPLTAAAQCRQRSKIRQVLEVIDLLSDDDVW